MLSYRNIYVRILRTDLDDVLRKNHIFLSNNRRIASRRKIAGEKPYPILRVGDDLGLRASSQDHPRAGGKIADVDRIAHFAAWDSRGAVWRHVIRSSQLSASMNWAQRR